MSNRIIQSIIISFFAVIISFTVTQAGWLKRFENRLWDIRVSYLSEPSKHNSSIKIILIDQNSLDWAESNNALSWPWPREMYTAIVDYCRIGGAKVVAFDILFSEASLYGVSDDERFARSLQYQNSIGALVLSNHQGSQKQWPLSVKNNTNIIQKSSLLKSNIYSKATFPIYSLADSFSALGFVSDVPDNDGVIRRVNLMNIFDNHNVPSLALSMYLSNHSNNTYTQENGHFCLNNVCINFDVENKAIINYHGPAKTYESVNAASVIESKLLYENGDKVSVSPEFFKDSYVLVGVSAPGLMDQKSTPLQGVYPGVEIHATVLDNLLSEDFVSDTPASITILFLSVLVFITALGVRYHTSILAAIFYLILAFLVIVTAGIFAYYQNSWLDISLLLMGVIIASAGAFGINYMIEGRQRRFIKDAFSRYLSPKVIDLLIEQPESLKLGGRRETLSILFSDIEGFTAICSHLPPEEIAHFLNDYLGLMSDTIMELGGTIDKFEGDAIIAFWNAPIAQNNHAVLAVKSALECQKLLEKYREHFMRQYGHEIKTRFGIHTGEVIIGNLGTERRFDFTFIGDAGNLASRLESANKQFGSYLMISQTTKDALKDAYYCRSLGTVKVVGRDEALNIFEPMEYEKVQNIGKILEDYHQALIVFYSGDFSSAQEKFIVLADRDKVAKTYVSIVDKLKTGEMIFENGVLLLNEK